MLALYWIVKVYRWWLFAFVILSWVPGIANSSFYALLAIPVWPILAPFQALNLGMVSFAPLIPAILLGYLETWAGRQAGVLDDNGRPISQGAPVDPSVYASEMQRPADSNPNKAGL
jgi:uncharacterized protein YggT (Ycf19 family)